ncbi:MAG: hypothetical protein LBB48_10370, partial [Treponema sp.]|nr:hypothetical protein [Treponema sp.]
AVVAINAGAWNIPAAVAEKLAALAGGAETALDAAKNETTRTPVATARRREAFNALAAEMRDVKKRYFLEPPLTDADIVSLGLKPHDATLTPAGKPAAQVMAETYLVGRHELGVRLIYVTGSDVDPVSPYGLHASFFIRRKKGPRGPLVAAFIP